MKRTILFVAFLLVVCHTSAQTFTFQCVDSSALTGPNCDICPVTNLQSRSFCGLLIYRNAVPYKWIDQPYTIRGRPGTAVEYWEQIPNQDKVTILLAQTGFSTVEGMVDSTFCHCGGGGVTYIAGPGITISGDTISAADTSATNEIQRLDTFAIVSGVLRASLLNDGVPFSSVTLPVADGSETKVNPGTAIGITGTGTTATPYVVTNTADLSVTAGGTNALQIALNTSGQTPIFVKGVGQVTVTESATGDTVKIGGVGGIYGVSDTTTGNHIATIAADRTLTFRSLADNAGGIVPFRVTSTGNEPDIMGLYADGDSLVFGKSDTEMTVSSSTGLIISAASTLALIGDSVVVQTLPPAPGAEKTFVVQGIDAFLRTQEGIALSHLNQSGATSGQVVKWNGTAWVPSPDTGGGPDSTFAKSPSGLYAGKRITDNVYRTGKVGVGTTDTTARLNIGAVPEIETPAIRVTGNADRVFSLRGDTRGDSISDFSIVRGFFDNVSEVGDNQVVTIGFNTNPGGGRDDLTKPAMTLRMEEKYDGLANGIKTPHFEFHCPQVDFKNGGGSSRPISGYFGHRRAYGGSMSFESDYFSVSDFKTGTQKLTWGFGTNTPYIKGIDFLDTATMRFGLNNFPIFSQRNAANTGYVAALKVDNLDRVLLGGGGESRVAAYNQLQITNSGIVFNEGSAIQVGKSGTPNAVNIFGGSNGEHLFLQNTSGGNEWVFGVSGNDLYMRSYTGGDYPWWVDKRGPTYTWRSTQTGDIGLGIYAPAAKLDILTTGGATAPLFRMRNSGGYSTMYRTTALPEGAIAADPGDVAFSAISGTGRMWLKESGAGNTGWKEFLTPSNGITGSGTANQITYWSGVQTLTSSANGTYDGTDFLLNRNYTNTRDMNLVLNGNVPGLNFRASGANFSLFSNYFDPNTLSLFHGASSSNPITNIVNFTPTLSAFLVTAQAPVLVATDSLRAGGPSTVRSRHHIYAAGNEGLTLEASGRVQYTMRGSQSNADNRVWRWETDYFNPGSFTLLRSATNGGSPTNPAISTDHNGQVGIGVGVPTQPLHVSGNARVTGAIYDSNNDPGTSAQVLSSTVTGTDWVTVDSNPGDDITGSGTTSYVPKFTSAQVLGNSQIFDNGTNVGVGTASPSEALHVSGNTRTDGTLTTRGTGTLPVLHLHNTTGGTGFDWTASSYDGGNFAIGHSGIGNAIEINGTTEAVTIDGPVTITNATGTATAVTGRTSAGVITNVTVGSGLSLSGGTLTSTAGTAYQTLRDDGADMTQRAAANFVSTTTVSAALTDDAGGETEIRLTVPADGITATEIAANAVGASELSSLGTAGTYGSATQVPVFTTDADGRVSAVTNTTITGTLSGLTATRVPFASGANTLDDDNRLRWDDTNKRLSVGDTGGSPSASVHIAEGSVASWEPLKSVGTVSGNMITTIHNAQNSGGASNNFVDLSVGGASGGDPAYRLLVNGVNTWVAAGIDNSAGDLLKIGPGTTPSSMSNVGITMTADATPLIGINNDAPLHPLHVVGRATATVLQGISGTPTHTFGSGAGTGPSLGTLTGMTNGISIQFTLGTSPTVGGNVVSITYPTAFSNISFVTYACRNDRTATENGAGKFVVSATSATAFTIKHNAEAAALTGGDVLFFMFTILGR